MMKLVASVCIDAPAEVVWSHLAKLEDIQLWSSAVLHAKSTGKVSQGVGAERVCELVGNRTITERWVAWDEGRSFQYEGFGIPMMNRATNRWSVIPRGAQSMLVSEAEVEMKGGVLGRLLEPVLTPVMNRMAPSTLAAFKYLVEHGQPYAGKVTELPPIAATC
jgi:ligand-binding SRPBCC domain-containing protein